MHFTSLSLSVPLVSTMSAVLLFLVINLPGKISPSLQCTLTGLLPRPSILRMFVSEL